MIDAQIVRQIVHLADHHRRKLFVESGIAEDVALERHYNTATADEYAKVFAADGETSLIPRLPGLLIPIFNQRGEEVTCQLRSDNAQADGAKYASPKRREAEMVLDSHPRIVPQLLDTSVDLWITEGIPKADSAISRGLCCIGLLGVWMAFRKNARGGVEALPGWDNIALSERNVYIAFDSDIVNKPDVRRALIRLLTFLKNRGAFPHVVCLPSGPHGEKVGLDDFFVQGGTVDALYKLVQPRVPDAFDPHGRPMVDVNEGDLDRVTRDAVTALKESNEPVALMMRAGHLVRIERDERNEVVVRDLDADGVRHELAARIAWYASKNSERTAARAPRDVAVNVLETPALGFPALRGITEVPTFRPDGTLHAEPGYDAATGWYYAPAEGLEVPAIPDDPTDDDVAATRKLLLDDLLVDFPFVADRDRAHALALALLPFARGLIAGPTPLHVIEAPTHGSGKGKLARMLLTIGRTDHATSTPWPTDESEVEKRLLSFLMNGSPTVIFDNVEGNMRSSSLCLALTEPVYTGRVLGKTFTPKFEVRTIWAMTSNNANLHKDIARRSIPCRIDPRVERPNQRDGFKHPSLEEWASENRGALLAAALTLVRAWIARGRKSSRARPLGSYEAWTRVMGGILDVAGVPGFLTGLDDFYEMADEEQSPWVAFLAKWHDEHRDKRVKASTMFKLALDSGLVSAAGSEAQQMIRFGRLLSGHRDRIAGGYCITTSGKRDGSAVWVCNRVSADAVRPEGGTDAF